jgi:hypothetical protein
MLIFDLKKQETANGKFTTHGLTIILFSDLHSPSFTEITIIIVLLFLNHLQILPKFLH